jgi:ribosomal protein S18 acetylase RimI-like enzyme
LGAAERQNVRPRDMNMTIRDAIADDLDALVELNGEVQGIHVCLFPDVFHETEQSALRAWFMDQMADPSTTILVGLEEERIVAYLLLRIFRRESHVFCRGRNWAYVDHVSVAADFRRRGFGRLLVGEAARRAKHQGISRLELDVWSDNKAAKSAFEALGFKTFNEKMFMET